MSQRIRSLLVANRGEIAIRVMRAASELGLRTVAIYSQEDRFSLHRTKADEAYLVGRDKQPVAAYLDIEDILRIAREARVDAIHPGYGFLSENPDFAQACAEAGIVFVGPTPQIMRTLGNKVAARNLATSAGVPVMPATPPLPQDIEACRKAAAAIGYPVMLKASWGGGGRGMRIVESDAQLAEMLPVSRREAHGGLRQRRGVSREARAPRAPRRSADSRRYAWRAGARVRARLHGAASQSEGRGARAGCVPHGRAARAAVRRSAQDRPRGRVSQCRHRRVPPGRGHRRLLFHRSESAHPGGAHRHGVRDGHRSGEGADPHRRRRAHRHARERRAAAVGDPPERARPAVPRDDGGSGKQLRSGLRRHRCLSQPGGLRHSPRRGHGVRRRDDHALLRFAAREGHGLVADARGNHRAHASRALGVPHSRRRDQPAFPRSGHHASALRARRTTRRASSTRRRSCSAGRASAIGRRASWPSSAM